MNKNDIVEYTGRKYYVIEINYAKNNIEICRIHKYNDGHRDWYSFDAPDDSIVVPLERVSKSYLYIGLNSFVESVKVDG